MTRRNHISILSLIVLFMAMVAQFHHHDSQMCVKDTLTEGHSCQLNPQTFVFTWRSPLSDIAVAPSALPDGGDALVPLPCECLTLLKGANSRETTVITAISSDHILRGPPARA